MNNFFRTIGYSLVAGLLIGGLLILYASGNALQDVSLPIQNTVTNFDSCKQKGYQLVYEGREVCITPSGIRFMNIRGDIATTSVEVLIKK